MRRSDPSSRARSSAAVAKRVFRHCNRQIVGEVKESTAWSYVGRGLKTVSTRTARLLLVPLLKTETLEGLRDAMVADPTLVLSGSLTDVVIKVGSLAADPEWRVYPHRYAETRAMRAVLQRECVCAARGEACSSS